MVAVAKDSSPETEGFGNVMDQSPVEVEADDDRLAASSAGLNSLPFGDPMINVDEPVEQMNEFSGHHRMIFSVNIHHNVHAR